MELLKNNSNHPNFWFIDAQDDWYGENMQVFFKEGFWQARNSNDFKEAVLSVQTGDRIALKTAFTRDTDVSVISIIATGTVTDNPGDGQKLNVDWQPLYTEPREWHSPVFSNSENIWKVEEGEWMNNSLISFTFDEEGHHRNLITYWKNKYDWIDFYRLIAIRLLDFEHARDDLVKILHKITEKIESLPSFLDQLDGGLIQPINDVCPFTVMGIFNRDMPDVTRRMIAAELANQLNVDLDVPSSFEGIPILSHEKCWFFGFQYERDSEDIERLWDLFKKTFLFIDSDYYEDRNGFADAFDNLQGRCNIGWNLSIGLFWLSPWHFVTLDAVSQAYINGFLDIPVGKNSKGKHCNSSDYLRIVDTLKERFNRTDYPVHSFPELSATAWLFQDKLTSANPKASDPDTAFKESQDYDVDDISQTGMEIYWLEPFLEKAKALGAGLLPDPAGMAALGADVMEQPLPLQASEAHQAELQAQEVMPVVDTTPVYSMDDIIAEGCFLPKEKLIMLLERIKAKKNLILQGPPGTGKTWLTKRIAYALVGHKNPARVRAVEFHSNVSYEDFIRGWRPTASGKLSLVDGPFLEMINLAMKNPDIPFVVIIEEINRGNPSIILGEMLTLLEADKRSKENALELCYRRFNGERIYIPPNLHVIGSMNMADRSLALIDFALRRRFAFVDLVPLLGEKWRQWVHKENHISMEILLDIEARIKQLNEVITQDNSLGREFCVGHSYVTPVTGVVIDDPRRWFRQVIETEIGPLLHEYWFDDRKEAQKQCRKLIEGF